MVDFKKAKADMHRYAVLIPTKGRPRTMRKLFERQPFLNSRKTFIGVERQEMASYAPVLEHLAWVQIVQYDNPRGITSVAREHLRLAAVQQGFKTYLPLDDNMFYSQESLEALVGCSELLNRVPGKPTIISGEHPTAAHFQADRIERMSVVDGSKYRVFPHTTVIYWAIPGSIYERYRYPGDCCFDDIHLALWMMTNEPKVDFYVCRDAPFDKRRFEAGGQGDAAARAFKFGQGICRLAADFPQWMTTSIVQTRIPYLRIQKAIADGQKGFDQKAK